MVHYFITIKHTDVLFCHREELCIILSPSGRMMYYCHRKEELCIILSPSGRMMYYFVTVKKNYALFYYHQDNDALFYYHQAE
jgi:hypothetical protein